MRDNILLTLFHFGPTTIPIVGRLLHIENMERLYTECQECLDDGLVETTDGTCDQISDTYALTTVGHAFAEPMAQRRPPINQTKFQVFKILQEKDTQMKHLNKAVRSLLDQSHVGLTVLDIKNMLRDQMYPLDENECILNSALFALLSSSYIKQCGPLYFTLPTILQSWRA